MRELGGRAGGWSQWWRFAYEGVAIAALIVLAFRARDRSAGLVRREDQTAESLERVNVVRI